MKMLRWLACVLVIGLVVVPAFGETNTKAAQSTGSVTVTGIVESVNGDALTVRVLSAPSKIRKLEKGHMLNVSLAPTASIMMGKKKIAASELKAGERVTIRGYVKDNQFIATQLSARK